MISPTRKASFTYTLPSSVVGGAKKSGFSEAILPLFGPIILAPMSPRIESYGPGKFSSHTALLGSRLMNGTVADEEGAVLVEVPETLTALVDVGDTDAEGAVVGSSSRRTAGAGTAREQDASRRATRQVERRIMMLKREQTCRLVASL